MRTVAAIRLCTPSHRSPLTGHELKRCYVEFGFTQTDVYVTRDRTTLEVYACTHKAKRIRMLPMTTASVAKPVASGHMISSLPDASPSVINSYCRAFLDSAVRRRGTGLERRQRKRQVETDTSKTSRCVERDRMASRGSGACSDGRTASPEGHVA